ncbi:ATP synthase protein I [Acidovorax sp. 93]|jgi:ATP synthase protein I|uniref:ATP synthase subunit I n=1 Tax=Acidovorax facilis TaxID=12917 RepID=A0ABV8DI63_9BURK|nr:MULTISPECIES: ATP synthase subunit I [Acidovorax]MBT9440956.1 ATP synthase subunit I [Acidovorax sp.]ODS61798.1 MAG: ATP synthase subunit I [Acidovorax sp. SCN 65-108]OGA59853.1 MAG: ATP synthase subunit I [Burkholderiales bacterium RIFCSPHIGHO2_01_FULL_64_960]OGB08303.1 MAG: ATP synthase subunit I [Burkholderiales bacterium RIFCSPHIGHO2_02_FULL_64_19]OGB20341.1 MAG: ATP synthase subunit I [Burkholderiales bacterium RIFCSPHIGHO2_12_FULL_65_48]OGB54854.1 MAG: ATP synthase subunit I [Burkhol
MKTIPPETEIEAEESDFKPLTAEEAEVWRSRNPSISVWKVVAGQALVGMLVALVAWALTGRASVGWSAAYGALAVVAPAALFARGVLRHSASSKPRAAMVGFFGWEIAKIVLTVALLAAAPRLVSGLSWIALLVGMVVAMKTYWVALLVRPGVRKTD